MPQSPLFPHLAQRRIVLASQSPRRRELISMLGLQVECLARDVDESWPSSIEGPEVAEVEARKKAFAFHVGLVADDVLVTGDTVVVLEGKVLEKPGSEAHAKEMLHALSGATHTVASAVAVTTLAGGTQSALDTCEVTFASLSDAFIDLYVASGSPMDKAGAYSVQEWMGLVGVTHKKGSL